MARDMLARDGYDGLSLTKLAAALQIKAPSLYNHFASKAALMQAVNALTARALTAAVAQALTTQPGDADLKASGRVMANAYRGYALANPVAYRLAFAPPSMDEQPDPAQLAALAIPLQAIIAQAVGEERSLMALRGLWALVHGYVMLEMYGQFQRGGSLEATFQHVVDAYLAGITAGSPSDQRQHQHPR
jgi:AcrR family transcriptional regulator